MKSILSLLIILFSYNSIGQTLTEVIYPRYVQGVGTSNASDDRKVPFVCRMTVSGLTANTLYRYYNKFVADPALPTNGQGNYIIVKQTGDFARVTSATLATAGRYGEFTTDAAGSYTGWFIVEPSLALEFQPGTILYFRLMLNNGAGGGSVATRVTSTNPVTVLGWGNAPSQGTGLRSIAIPSVSAKNFIILHDNEAGTGRPITGTFVESDGTDNNATTSGYAPFYANSVDGSDKTWGTIIPNNLPTGVRRIAQHSLADGSLVNSSTTTNGVYPTIPSGTIATANAGSGLTELVIAPAMGPVPVKLLAFELIQSGNNVNLNWKTAIETGFSNFVIEKSINGSDYYSIGSVDGRGDNSTYQFPDVIREGVTYYRLKVIDLDARFVYSKIVTASTKDDFGLKAYPNPVRNLITIDHSFAKAGATFRLIGINGSTVAIKSLQKGLTSTSIDMSGYAAGDYILIYTNGEQVQKIQINKQ